MIRLQPREIAEITGISLLIAVIFRSIRMGLMAGVAVFFMVLINSGRKVIVEMYQQVHHFIYNAYSWWYDGKPDMKEFARRLNTKTQSLRDFRANYKNQFRFPATRKVLLKFLDEDSNFFGDCYKAIIEILENMQHELVVLSPILMIGPAVRDHILSKIDMMVGCEYPLAELAELMIKADQAITDHLLAYGDDISGLTLADLCSKIGVRV